MTLAASAHCWRRSREGCDTAPRDPRARLGPPAVRRRPPPRRRHAARLAIAVDVQLEGQPLRLPDRTACRDRIIFVELKRELTGRKSEDAKRQPSDAQIAWLDRLASADGEVYLWRPSDLDEIARVLSTRWQFVNGRLGSADAGGVWTPGSIWIPGRGRADTQEQLMPTG